MQGADTVKIFILRSLIKKDKFGGAHTPLDNVTRGISDKLMDNKKGQKAIDKALKELTNEGFVIVLHKRTGKGSDLHVSINPRKIREISEYLGSPEKAL